MFKKVITSIVAVLLVFSAIVIPSADEANAEWNVKSVRYKKNVTVYMFPKSREMSGNVYGIDLGKRVKNAKKVTFKTSKKGVITNLDFISDHAVFTAKKTGKTALTIKVKNKNGTTKKYKVNVTVKKIDAFKSIKIGETNYTKKLKSKDYMSVRLKSNSAKISIRPKKGWKVSKLYYYAEYDGDDEDLMYNEIEKTYKNNSVIEFKGTSDYWESVSFTMTDKSTGTKISYSIDILH